VVAEVREELSVIKQATPKFDKKRFNLRKLSELEVKKQYKITMSNRFVALENLTDKSDMNKVWKNLKENIKTSEL
jgi:glycine betaine/choline ABC-type transport system substrate-binding protein